MIDGILMMLGKWAKKTYQKRKEIKIRKIHKYENIIQMLERADDEGIFLREPRETF